ncbi:hypothetical protein DWB61_05265 [Ancylomarina euxinus]|uniref:Uncharacterized protein n=1 Tax=Ancylomarina euxinus TaxID=2283627 RepID=A0A425Y6A9_9BACT|nr:hypothetical protein [Ancylomarina euxinus]MCZ4694179.1 hypothetical protein [Ancylomarina euxinus]MUP14490.1 hypothetical protein [Ancylomarina euxinus]RRG23791.1 hypothetical protein DWB61_05265 [Ancylomarina euxinus]
MLQFEYDIRSHKVKALNGKSKQLAVGIAFVITAIVLYFFVRYLEIIYLCKYFAPFLIIIASIYTVGILLGCKFMYPREYLKINSRRIKYKYGWFKRRIKIYRKDIKEFKLINHELIVLTKEQEEFRICLKDFSDEAIMVLKGYLNITTE